jgi:hypothetical protein
MIHLIAAKTCTEAWLRAANLLADTADRIAYNVILDIEQPITVTAVDQRIVEAVDRFLKKNEADPVATVAATIFPASDYRRNGVKGVFEDFPEKTYPKLTKTWGTYAGRLLRRGGKDGTTFNPLELTIRKLRAQKKRTGPLRSIYEASLIDVMTDLPIFDPGLDSKRNQGQPCLAHLSFKLREDNGLMLTAMYRNHYYVQRALGNLLGLSQLLFFVARESGLTPKSLVCHSTFARLDTDKGWSISEVKRLLVECNELAGALVRQEAQGVMR